jgi:hypothetical protein
MNRAGIALIHPYADPFLDIIRDTGPQLFSHEVDGINSLVKDLVYYDVWNRLVALYPFVGRNAIPHSFNLINPLTFRITWQGTITHDARGITTDGSTGTGNTGLNPAADPAFVDSLTFGVYSRTNATSGGVDLGAQTASNLHIKFSDNNAYFDNCFSSGRISTSISTSLGLILSSRVSGSDHGGWQNGTKIIWGSGAQGAITSSPFFIASRTGNQLFTARNYALCVIGYGLTDNQNRWLYEGIQRLQTTLRRNV